MADMTEWDLTIAVALAQPVHNKTALEVGMSCSCHVQGPGIAHVSITHHAGDSITSNGDHIQIKIISSVTRCLSSKQCASCNRPRGSQNIQAV